MYFSILFRESRVILRYNRCKMRSVDCVPPSWWIKFKSTDERAKKTTVTGQTVVKRVVGIFRLCDTKQTYKKHIWIHNRLNNVLKPNWKSA